MRLGLALLLALAPAGAAEAKPTPGTSVATPLAANRMIVIKPTTKSVNVFTNDIVLFRVGDKQFAIRFDANHATYDLETLAPPGVLDHKVTVHVAPSPAPPRRGAP